ncbi:MAG: hypothetical protein HZB16_07215 [Armatimonadetes bacterium]|nr:hypothetical protein [Armatimonadota bacterium]
MLWLIAPALLLLMALGAIPQGGFRSLFAVLLVTAALMISVRLVQGRTQR